MDCDQERPGSMDDIQTAKDECWKGLKSKMGLTKDFRTTTYARARRDARFRKALLTEAVNAYLSGEETIGKAVLRDFINATIGFEKLASAVQIPSKSLHRMLSSNGNPSTANFFAILRVLQDEVGLQLKVRVA
jgi:DNA-binding phage protein